MNTPRQSFSQVKDILKKLDQSIDAARAKRVGGEPARPAVRPAEPPAPIPAPAPLQARPYSPGATPPNGTFGRQVG